MSDILDQLARTLEQRKQTGSDQSYVARLHAQGLNEILKKVGEEATEVILAAKDAERKHNNQALIAETADLWFHCMVMLSYLEDDHQSVLKELESRFGLSGLVEKSSRPSV